MAIENVQQLLTEQLGKNGGTEIFTTVNQTSKDWYCVFFPVESVIASITVADADGFVVNDGGTMKTIPATDVKTYASGSSATKGFAIAMAIAL